jgi:hypothetical protein
MRRRFLILFILIPFITIYTDVINAQSPLFSIFDQFDQPAKKGEGTVIIHQSESLKSLVGTRIDSQNLDMINGKSYLKTEGFRVQIYSGNNLRTSRDESFGKQNQIKELYPGIPTYVTYDAPFWKLHVGDYISFEEASQMLRELRNTFPKAKKEIYVIEDQINVLLED